MLKKLLKFTVLLIRLQNIFFTRFLDKQLDLKLNYYQEAIIGLKILQKHFYIIFKFKTAILKVLVF